MNVFFLGIVVWRREAKNRKCSCLLWSLLRNERFLHIAHRHTQSRLVTPIDAPPPHGFQIPIVYKHFACVMVRSAQELFATEKMAAQGMKIADDKKEQHGDDRPHRATQGHSAKHVITKSFDTPWHCTKTQTAPHAFYPKWGSLDPQMGSPIGAPKKSKLVTRRPFLLFFASRK